MKKIKKILAMMTAVGLMSACGPLVPWDDNPNNRVIDVSNLQITCNGIDGDAIALTVKGTLQLTVVVTPADATDQAVAFVSSDEAVATVSADGLVTALSTGQATITVVSASNPNVSHTITVSVADKVMNVEDAIDQAEAEARKR